ncbi:hypothetical protein [Nonomuraea cavernae]|uniref:hypothetical protein n=1 Tax=Nonomuraea cavernae TaxID=2045107 RepID=UPI0033CA869D
MASVSELIGQSVWDVDGIWIGHVVDIRVVRHRGELQRSQTVQGLMVSASRRPIMLGLTRDRPGRRGRLSGLVARLIYAGCTFVPWSAVEEYDEGEVHLSAGRKELTRA